MPNIVIREEEKTSLRPFDATENIVLVPLLTDSEVEIATRPVLFNDYFEFKASSFWNNIPSIKVTNNSSESSEAETIIKDKSYFVITELLNAGLKVLVKPFKVSEDAKNILQDAFDATEDGDLAFAKMVNALIVGGTESSEGVANDSIFKEFKNKNLYNIKFITTGYWPNVFKKGSNESVALDGDGGCYTSLTALADNVNGRGDCVALVELQQDFTPEEVIAFNITEGTAEDNNSLKNAVCTYPAIKTTLPTNSTGEIIDFMPASFGYLMAYANSVRVNANWFAASGIIRGSIPTLVDTKYDITEGFMRTVQDSSKRMWKINVIMRTGNYGIRLWGNRVMGSHGYDGDITNLTFSDFLNVRILLCDLKKQIYHAALRSTFEPNDDITWVNFKKLCNTLLDKMQSGRGISWYSWKKEVVTEKATIKAILTIKPIEAVEYFEITINLSDEDVEFAEV